MSIRFLVAACLTLTVVGTTPALTRAQSKSQPERGAPALDEKSQAKLDGELRMRINDWDAAHNRLITECPTCGGKGWINGGLESVPGTPNKVIRKLPCGRCDGQMHVVAQDDAREALGDFRSPAWHARDGASKELDTMVRELLLVTARKMQDNTRRYAGADFVDATHAVVHVREAGNEVHDYRWIRVEGGGAKRPWYLWYEESDGAWPEGIAFASAPKESETADEPAEASDAPPEEAEEPVELEDQPADELGALVKDLDSNSTISDWHRTLVLTPRLRAVRDDAALLLAVRDDAIAYVKAVIPATRNEWDETQLVFEALGQDGEGGLVWKPVWTVSLTNEDFDATAWDELDEAQAWGRFRTQQHTHAGWTRVPLAAAPPSQTSETTPTPK